ncbi:unnamed protein product [Protopolystoma xenopodis]|uniref:Uncharacterized protein n=1 Tax=Protopolystoma xenopodis TaxID=117903 RepID=A0A448WW38_9PLAT|nr:unnamed protein product [Protopolystoma xenopodis]
MYMQNLSSLIPINSRIFSLLLQPSCLHACPTGKNQPAPAYVNVAVAAFGYSSGLADWQQFSSYSPSARRLAHVRQMRLQQREHHRQEAGREADEPNETGQVESRSDQSSAVHKSASQSSRLGRMQSVVKSPPPADSFYVSTSGRTEAIVNGSGDMSPGLLDTSNTGSEASEPETDTVVQSRLEAGGNRRNAGRPRLATEQKIEGQLKHGDSPRSDLPAVRVDDQGVITETTRTLRRPNLASQLAKIHADICKLHKISRS